MSCNDTDYLPVRWNLPSAVSGDSFPGIGAISILINGAIPPNALSAVVMSLSGMDLTTFNGKIVIDNATTWTFSIPEFPITLNPGVHTYELKTYSVTGQVRTYLHGSWKLI